MDVVIGKRRVRKADLVPWHVAGCAVCGGHGAGGGLIRLGGIASFRVTLETF